MPGATFPDIIITFLPDIDLHVGWASLKQEKGLTNKDGDWGGAHEGADNDGYPIAAVCQCAVWEIVCLGINKPCMRQTTL